MSAPPLRLVRPSTEYAESFISALEELRTEPVRRYDWVPDITLDGVGEYSRTLEEWSAGRNLPAHLVACTDYWLVDGEDYVGTVSIRHELTEQLRKVGGHIGYTIRPSRRRRGYGSQILALALTESKALGLGAVLLTCDKTNTASVRIIEKNGGALEDEQSQGDGDPSKLRSGAFSLRREVCGAVCRQGVPAPKPSTAGKPRVNSGWRGHVDRHAPDRSIACKVVGDRRGYRREGK